LRLRGAIRYDKGNGGTHKPWSVFLPPVPSNNNMDGLGRLYTAARQLRQIHAINTDEPSKKDFKEHQ
jgi:hypothetical protein